jgi:hypothetical protein
MPQIFQFKIILKNIEPKIWRRFQVKDNITFADMHRIILVVMGWDGSHLHQFVWNKHDYIGSVEHMPGDVEDERKISINQIFKEIKTKLVYEYDFGDDWEHDLILEEILEDDRKIKYAYCLDGKNNCPPEDCGGPWGFADMMDKLKSADSEEKEELLEWLGDDYDPSFFDLKKINEELLALTKKFAGK